MPQHPTPRQKRKVVDVIAEESKIVDLNNKRTRAKIDVALQMKTISPKTDNQTKFFEQYEKGKMMCGLGSAGVGKSFIATYLGMRSIMNKEQDKLIIVRSAVSTRNSGFLPGTLEEKEEVYKAPYKEIVNDLFDNGTAWCSLSKKEIIRFVTTSYIRGITIDNAVIIIDEVQNFTTHELLSVLSRIGKNSRVIIIGDTKQCDLDAKTGKTCFDDLKALTNRMWEWFSVVNFNHDDIVRSGFCKALIIAAEEVIYQN